jgi:putative glutamine amidotransferase
MSRPAFVGLPADRKYIGPHPFHAVGEKYIRAAVEGAGLVPFLIPALGGDVPLEAMLERLDGIILTGAVSNIEPHHYSDEQSWEGNEHDPHRDATTLPLVGLAIEMDRPVLALCRGFQEVNVALGGTLHQKVHETPDFHDHREDADVSLAEQYGPAHAVRLEPGGLLAHLHGGGEAIVNSLHGQGIRELAPGLVAEARAPDGLIEAARLGRQDRFLLGVQWHPEWLVTQNPFYLEIFKAFGAACRARASKRS